MLKKLFLFAGLGLVACQSARTSLKQESQKPDLKPISAKVNDGKIRINILHINDVYEIAPLQGGKLGGMARVAMLNQNLRAENTNMLFVHAGDFLNPSVIGSLKYEGKRIQGKQMVECMNEAGVQLATFGNHEFDLKEGDLLARIDESKFDWAIANLQHKTQDKLGPFQQRGVDMPPYRIYKFKDADGTEAKIGIVAVCLGVNQPDYLAYQDPFEQAAYWCKKLEDSVDCTLLLTHLDIEDDLKLAAKLPKVPLLMGGHDHSNMYHKLKHNAVAKADANALTAYVHRIDLDLPKKGVSIHSYLQKVDSSIGFEPKTQALVQHWQDLAHNTFKDQGFDPESVVYQLVSPLDARESLVRYRPSEVGSWCAKALILAWPEAQASLFNTGGIRIDDVLQGQLTEFDLIRMLPFGGASNLVEIRGRLLLQVLKVGMVQNVGKGGYLALENLRYDAEQDRGFVGTQAIEAEAIYRIALPSFLLSGQELNLEFLKAEHPDLIKVYPSEQEAQKDIRKALREYLKAKKQ